MDGVTVTVVISATTTLIVAWLANHFARAREHEADWRKMKLERYREYILALSGMVEERANLEAQTRYADAVNSLMLVAPPFVMSALDALLAETSYRNMDKNAERQDKLLGDLIRLMRKDIQPKPLKGDDELQFRLLGVPPPD